MPRRNDGCAWGGCDDTPRPGHRMCDAHERQVQQRAAQPVHTIDSGRAALPHTIAGPIAGKAATSKAAALNVRDTYVTKKGRILQHLVACGARGATRPELAAALDLPINSINSACNTLYRQGLVGSNPGDVRPDPNTGNDCAVVVHEHHVERWKGHPRAVRAAGWRGHAGAGECDLVHPVTGEIMSETEAEQLRGFPT